MYCTERRSADWEIRVWMGKSSAVKYKTSDYRWTAYQQQFTYNNKESCIKDTAYSVIWILFLVYFKFFPDCFMCIFAYINIMIRCNE